jgi:hypothetical protein
MSRVLPVLAVVPLLLAYGVAEGLWSERWRTSAELEQAPAKLARLPKSVGPWRGEDGELGAREVRQAELRAHLLRHYVHAETGEALTVLAVCGRPGPVAVHSPQVCFGGSGFTPSGPRARHVVRTDGPSAELWAERYQKSGAIPEHLEVYYGWNAASGWEAADNPRLRFAGARALYKLYVVRRLARPDEAAADGPVPDFLRLFVPALDDCLFGPH